MGKHVLSSEQSIVQTDQENNPGCMWGIFQILDYHHWHVKRVIPHKKKRHARYERKAILHSQVEDQQYGVAEVEPLLVRQHDKKSNATSKRSPKNSKNRISSLPGETQHLGSSEKIHKGKARDTTWDYLRKDGKTTEAAHSPKHGEENKLDNDIYNKFKKHSDDAFEILRVEKDLLLKFLRDLDVGRKNSHQASHNKARLKKSGTFPLTTSSQTRNIKSSTLKHKQNETWAFPKREKLHKLSAPGFGVVDSGMKQKQGITSRPSHHHKGWNQLVLHHFKVIKQKIKHALVEFKKSGYQTSVQAIRHHRDSHEYSMINREKKDSESLDDGAIDQEDIKNKSSNENKASGFDDSSYKREISLVRRTSSLNESMDRYTQLFERSFSKDAKWNSSKSKSLKLTNEDRISKSGHAPRFSRSNFSLPNFDSLGFILHEALLDTNDTGNAVETDNHVQRKSVSFPMKIDKSLDHSEVTEITETIEEGGRDVDPIPVSGKLVEKIDGVTCEVREDIQEPTVEDESFPHENEELSMTIYPRKEATASLEISSEDNTTSHAEDIIEEFYGHIVQGTELYKEGSSFDESKVDLPYSSGSVHPLPSSLSKPNATVIADGSHKSSDNHSMLFKSNTDKDSNFKYVKSVLELSGFMGNEQVQMWHTIDQPLNPSLLMDLDGNLCQEEIESSGKDRTNPYDDHLLLFNLVDEVLLEIYEKSPTYFPRPFSFNYRLHSRPKGQYLLNEVWNSVKSYLSLRPELDQTLEDVVSRDLAKRSGWMNLQQEEENVALELEEMIMDDLLHELIFS